MKAFPHMAKVHMLDGNSIIREEITSGGMDLRDYFAAKAMQEILKDYFMEDRYIGDFLDFCNMFTEERVAKLSYAMANAMIEARDD